MLKALDAMSVQDLDVRVDCFNYKRSKGKAINVTLSDESSDGSHQPDDKKEKLHGIHHFSKEW
jgi:hypothetical protein